MHTADNACQHSPPAEASTQGPLRRDHPHGARNQELTRFENDTDLYKRELAAKDGSNVVIQEKHHMTTNTLCSKPLAGFFDVPVS